MPMLFVSWAGRLCASWLSRFAVLMLLLWNMGLCETETRELCNVARDKCVSRVGCGMAMHNYYIGCSDLIHGVTSGCTPRCRKALVSLLSTEDKGGEVFMECDCDGVELCENHKARLEVCSRDVLEAIRNVYGDTDISCSLAEMICRADASCLAALDYYMRHCGKMFRGEKCTPRCNNSLEILYRQAKAWKLRTCICDGTEDFDCQTIQQNSRRLCFRHEHRTRHPNHHNHTRTKPSSTSHGSKPQGGSGMEQKGVQPTEINNVVNLASGTRVAHISPLTLAALLPFLVTWSLHR